MSLFNVLQVSTKDQLKKIDGNKFSVAFDRRRFLEYTEEDIRIFYKVVNNDNLKFLKEYPTLITVEQFNEDVSLVKILEISYQEDSLSVHVVYQELLSYSFYSNIDTPYFNSDERKQENKKIADEKEQLKTILSFENLEEYRNHWAVKSGDFFDKIKSSFLSDFYGFSGYFPKYKKYLPVTQFISPESISVSAVITGMKLSNVSVDGVSDFFDKIIYFNRSIETKNREFFYRGHSNADNYLLEPSLFREYKSKGPIYLKSEYSSFRELLTTEPRSFTNDTTCFDILTRMQHYSLPTRLLDISSNPLAALYFACSGSDEVEGEVILLSIKKDAINYFDSDKVTCLTNLAKLKETQKEDLSKLIQKCEKKTALNSQLDEEYFNESTSYAQYIHFIRQEKPYFEPKILTADLRSVICVKGRLNQDRIIAQAGSFLIFGLDAFLPEEGTELINIYRIRIEATNKKRMLDELDLLGVNSRTIYPSMENTSKYIKAKLESGS